MGMPRYDVPMPRQNLFDGKESWNGFIQPLRSLARSCELDDNEKGQITISSDPSSLFGIQFLAIPFAFDFAFKMHIKEKSFQHSIN